MNSEEIARIAKVSRSTVSRVVNNYKNVPPETRERVQKVIDEYGYTPNNSARTLAGKANNVIGLFIADIDQTNSSTKWIGAHSPYNLEFLSHVITSCKRRGYLTLVNTITQLKECQEMEQYFSNRMLYGGIFLGFPYRTKELEVFAEKGYNIVLVDQLSELDDKKHNIKLLNCDNYKGAYEATKLLLDKGHTQLVHVTGDHRLSSLEREKGFLDAVKDAKLKKQDYCVINGEYREDVAYEAMKHLLDTKKPTAVFAGNDIMALGVIRAIQERNMQIPEDISIVGFDNLESSEWLQLQLTSMGVSMEEMAEKSVALLFSKQKGIHEMCEPSVIERKSIKKIK